MMLPVADFLSGICMASFAASGLFFLKFWRVSKDRFFLFFCFASWILAIERVVLLVVREVYGATANANIAESNSWVYLLRLFAFLLILIAIFEKNRATLKR